MFIRWVRTATRVLPKWGEDTARTVKWINMVATGVITLVEDTVGCHHKTGWGCVVEAWNLLPVVTEVEVGDINRWGTQEVHLQTRTLKLVRHLLLNSTLRICMVEVVAHTVAVRVGEDNKERIGIKYR